MATEKYVNIGGVWKAVSSEYANIGGVWKNATTNYANIGGAWKPVPIVGALLFVPETTTRFYQLDTTAGADNWHENTVGSIAVACDSDGNSYWANGTDVTKCDTDGNVDWTFTGHTSTVTSVCVDADGDVYSGDAGGTVKRILSSGNQEWSQNLGVNYSVYGLAVDYSASIIYASTGNAEFEVHRLLKVNGNHARIYYSPIEADILTIAIDESASLYLGFADIGIVRKISNAGYVYPTFTEDMDGASGSVTQVVVGHDGYGYAALKDTKAIRKFDLSDGSEVWIETIGGTAAGAGVAVDTLGNVYGAFRKAGNSVDNQIRSVNSSGNTRWNWSPYVSAQFYKMAVTPGLKSAGF